MRYAPRLAVTAAFFLLSPMAVMAADAPAEPAPAAAVADTAPECMANYTQEGSFFRGRSMKTSARLPGTSQNTAYSRVYGSMARRGYQIESSEREAGVISASQPVSMSEKKVPINVVVTPDSDTDSSIIVSVNLPGGLSTSKEAVQKELCSIIADAAGAPPAAN
ncbi:MAG: hypothetical protein ACRC2H_00265 [Silanimonas sp.]